MPIRCVLLDVEGTTSSISFVYDQMFPFVRRTVENFVGQNWESESLQAGLQQLVADLEGDVSWSPQRNDRESQSGAVASILKLMDDDVKATGLKQIQGMIWKSGFESGELVSHLFDDVLPAIREWVSNGLQVRIYSSGSIQAQKLFFGHTQQGDLLEWLSGHYDTTIGSKKEARSYQAIAEDIGRPPEEVLFVSDVAAELVAARTAGMQVVLSVRPGNHPVEHPERFKQIREFGAIETECFN